MIVRWARVLLLLPGCICFPISFILYDSKLPDATEIQFLLTTLSFSFFGITLYLFFHPGILYGLWGWKVVNAWGLSSSHEKELNETPEIAEGNYGVPEKPCDLSYLESYKLALEKYIASAKPFLKQGYTIQDLSKETRIPQHHLSALINRVYDMRFNEYLNRMRIQFISENFGNPEWRYLTLEGIAKQSGFTSRTTFFNAIKKITGLCPSEFAAGLRSPAKDLSQCLTHKIKEV